MPTLSYPSSTHTLDNGLRVIISPDHATPTVALNLWYDVGSRHERIGRTGFAHLFEHLMFQGSNNVKAGEHIALMQAAGASVNATTWFDRTNYFEALPRPGLELALWLEADRMASLAVTEENFQTQREVVKEEKRQRYDNVPYGDVMERLIAMSFPSDHPYGHTVIGSMADLDAAELADVQGFFTTYYMPSNAVLSLAGDVEDAEGLALVERYFGAIPAGSAPAALTTAPLPAIEGQPRDEVTADVPADAVHMSWRVPQRNTPEFDAVDLASTIVGHGQTSRLHRRLVRNEELAESAGASSMAMVGGNSLAFMSAMAREGRDIAAVEQMALEELSNFIDQGPTEEEHNRAIATFERFWLQTLARIDSRADHLSEAQLLDHDPDLINRRIEQVSLLTPADLQAAAKKFFDPAARATVVHRRHTQPEPNSTNSGRFDEVV